MLQTCCSVGRGGMMLLVRIYFWCSNDDDGRTMNVDVNVDIAVAYSEWVRPSPILAQKPSAIARWTAEPRTL